MKIVDRFQPIFQEDRDLPLISGYVHAGHNEYAAAVHISRARSRSIPRWQWVI